MSLRWWKIEPPITTNVEGGATGNVASGNFQGGNVTINYAPPPEQPKTPKEYLNTMWLMMLESERQSREYRQRVMFWLIGLTFLVLANIAASVVGAWAWIVRFGWFW